MRFSICALVTVNHGEIELDGSRCIVKLPIGKQAQIGHCAVFNEAKVAGSQTYFGSANLCLRDLTVF